MSWSSLLAEWAVSQRQHWVFETLLFVPAEFQPQAVALLHTALADSNPFR